MKKLLSFLSPLPVALIACGATDAPVTGGAAPEEGSSSEWAQALAGPVTVEPGILSRSATPRGEKFELTYFFRGGSTAVNNTVFVHFLDASGAIVWGDDHVPPKATTLWSDWTMYQRTITVPSTAATGSYRVAIGLYDPAGGARLALTPDVGVTDLGNLRYQIASFTVGATSTRPVKLVGALCDKQTDDSDVINAALIAAVAGDIVRFPPGTCMHSKPLELSGKTDIILEGAGMDLTILTATEPSKSRFGIIRSSNVTLRDLQLASPSATTRGTSGESAGLWADTDDGLTVERVKINRMASAGMLFYGVSNTMVTGCQVLNTLADGIHMTNNTSVGSSNVTVRGNYANNSGDDSFSSVGYSPYSNTNVTIQNNTSILSQASGVVFEGTTGSRAKFNYIDRSRVAGMRVASIPAYSTNAVDNVTIAENLLYRVRMDAAVGHPAILVYGGNANISNITFDGNVIDSPNTWAAFQLYANAGYTVNTTKVLNTRVLDQAVKVTDCIAIGANTSSLTLTNNTRNGGVCD